MPTEGAAQVTATCCAPAVTATAVGAPGLAAGTTTATRGADAAPVPAALVATTSTYTVEPATSPVIVHVVAGTAGATAEVLHAADCVPAVAALHARAWYPVMADPPLAAGAVQETLAWAPVTVAVTPVGAPGAVIGAWAPSSRIALMMPAPQVFDAVPSHAPAGNAVTFDAVVINWVTCAGVRLGFADLIRATTPATWGVAMLVPL